MYERHSVTACQHPVRLCPVYATPPWIQAQFATRTLVTVDMLVNRFVAVSGTTFLPQPADDLFGTLLLPQQGINMTNQFRV
jgi:hypothetical protein